MSQHIPLDVFQSAISKAGKYTIPALNKRHPNIPLETIDIAKTKSLSTPDSIGVNCQLAQDLQAHPAHFCFHYRNLPPYRLPLGIYQLDGVHERIYGGVFPGIFFFQVSRFKKFCQQLGDVRFVGYAVQSLCFSLSFY